jgi:predicted SAM-dependent methyltransferase
MVAWAQVARCLPPALRRARLYQLLRRQRYLRGLRKQIAVTKPLNVVIGAGATAFPGWIQTDRTVLDITSPNDWRGLFEPGSIDRLLAEHVLEHLTEAECRIALSQAFCYLKPGGLFRIAVPDGYRRDAAYAAEVSPPHDGHKALYNIDSLVLLLKSSGFEVAPLEYFDAQEKFHTQPWDVREGLISRSVRFDRQTDFQRGELFYTSLIADARKPRVVV